MNGTSSNEFIPSRQSCYMFGFMIEITNQKGLNSSHLFLVPGEYNHDRSAVVFHLIPGRSAADKQTREDSRDQKPLSGACELHLVRMHRRRHLGPALRQQAHMPAKLSMSFVFPSHTLNANCSQWIRDITSSIKRHPPFAAAIALLTTCAVSPRN